MSLLVSSSGGRFRAIMQVVRMGSVRTVKTNGDISEGSVIGRKNAAVSKQTDAARRMEPLLFTR